ncbi:MAG: TPM domain-containing protein [Pyrinomonadaceae bacterium]
MTKIFRPLKTQFLLAALMILFASFAGFAQDGQPWSINNSPLPAPTGFVNDYAGVIDAVTKQQLESKLKNLRDTTNPSVEIAIAVVRTTGDRTIFDYSMAVARGWKIGSKEDDNPAALLFIAIDDRKYFTQVSRNLEDELPDAMAGSLQRQYLVPEFKKGNYGKGISDTIDAYIAVIQTGAAAPPEVVDATRDSGEDSISGFFCCAVIIIVILLVIFGRSKGGPNKGDRDRWGGGGFGGGGGGNALPIVMGILGGMLSGGSGGSSSSSWDGSSGGSDWGGFGGGGDFGGGGAGGGW